MPLNIKDLQIHSPAFTWGEYIPQRYTSDGENISPPLEWSGLPSGTQQLALICHDPDAPLPQGFTHWVIYGIEPTINQIAEADGSQFTQGLNSTNQPGYTGPAPPKGHGLHHYYFWLYALDTKLNLKANLNREQLLEAIANHVIEQARLIGVYQR
ncbi:YbhB/YbcL family Raf kinase inhibitor-like protein [Nostoc sp. FACHB-152]|uniref:YbhB/YbcL family Raf kinase inhibitor-like protein n=1 Tax=unclassified Nostoc TaxID=2593658 RepID=UPI0016882585|nr:MULTISPECIES: YbhB/YbcL family Raf kinase inhibitor-like protein [unclassified Nostoc]MBD2447134.1 YbhB/YbcL family Raf kinase inhibitor-like protein [Nostoc sp. FACHB-152]MBD2469188.1 YbhB/YbcL family Raf kinase inhibitor-like protein [Nostoc sp. FACHB-145]